MKIKIALACIAVTLIITFISCDWFSSKPNRSFDISGSWTIDSIQNKGSDPSKNTGMLALVLALQNRVHDSLPLGIQFNNDSSFQYLNLKDPEKGKYYLSEDKNSLFIQEDSVKHQFDFISKSDSAIAFTSADSVFYYLKRK